MTLGKLWLICGDDEFAVKERARAVAVELGNGAVPEENPALEIVAGDSEERRDDAIIGSFLEALRTPPFLCDRKLIWLRHFRNLDALCGKNESVGAAEVTAILSEPLPEEVSVLIDGFNCDQRKGFFKSLKSAGAEIEVLNAVRAGDRKAADNRKYNIRELAREFGCEIAADAVQFLSETLGGDSGTLYHELEKICCYVGDVGRITLADCRAVGSRTPETVSWEFTGAIVERDAARALGLLNVLLKQGEAEIRLLAALSGEFQKQIQTRLALRQLNVRHLNPRTFDSIPDELRERYPDNPLLKMHPYRAFKTCEGAMRFSDAELARNLELIRNASRALVSGGGDRRIILEQLILSLTVKR